MKRIAKIQKRFDDTQMGIKNNPDNIYLKVFESVNDDISYLLTERDLIIEVAKRFIDNAKPPQPNHICGGGSDTLCDDGCTAYAYWSEDAAYINGLEVRPKSVVDKRIEDLETELKILKSKRVGDA